MAAKCSTGLLCACLGLVVISGCRPSHEAAEEGAVLDLVSQLAQAEILSETGRIDLGTAAARGFLTRDWSWNEKDGTGTTFVWGGPWVSEVGIYRATGRPGTLRWRCLPYRQADGFVEGMAIRLDGEEVGRVDLTDGWQEYELELASESLGAGVHRLEFEYLWAPEAAAPADRRGGRKVAVAWDWIELTRMDEAAPDTLPEEGILRLPAGSRVDFFFDAPADAELVIDSISQNDEPGGILEISTLQDGSAPRQILRFAGLYRGQPLASRRRSHRSLPLKEVPNRWPLTASGGLVRLRLESTGSFELTRPTVVASTVPAMEPEPVEWRRNRDPKGSQPPLVLLYVIDTLRADHLDGSQATRERSPGFAALMQDGVIFDDTLAQSTWTKPTVASILTGQPPWTHGAQNANDSLSGDLDSLAARMRRLGYRTAGFSANGYVSQVFGFHHGFDHFALTPEFDTQSDRVHVEMLQWLDGQPAQKLFLFAQTIDPHAPYDPAEPFRSEYAGDGIAPEVGSVEYLRQLARSRREPGLTEIEDLRSLYSAEVAFLDRQFAALIEELKKRDLYDSALIVVMADHGEEFYEHGSWTHGRNLHREVLQVPMVIKFPRNWGAGSRVSHPVQQIDVLPTLLDYMGEAPPPSLPGRSLLCAVQQTLSGAPLGCATARPQPLFSSLHYHQNHWVGVVHEGWKLILPATERLLGEAQLYDLRIDRAELDNAAVHYPVRVGYLSTLIREELRRRTVPVAPEQVELDPETEERLRALGYLD